MMHEHDDHPLLQTTADEDYASAVAQEAMRHLLMRSIHGVVLVATTKPCNLEQRTIRGLSAFFNEQLTGGGDARRASIMVLASIYDTLASSVTDYAAKEGLTRDEVQDMISRQRRSNAASDGAVMRIRRIRGGHAGR